VRRAEMRGSCERWELWVGIGNGALNAVIRTFTELVYVVCMKLMHCICSQASIVAVARVD